MFQLEPKVGVYWYDPLYGYIITDAVAQTQGEVEGPYIVHHTTATKCYELEILRVQCRTTMYEGKVVYDRTSYHYQIVCDDRLLEDDKFRKSIIFEFGFNSPDVKFDFVTIDHKEQLIQEAERMHGLHVISVIDNSEEYA